MALGLEVVETDSMGELSRTRQSFELPASVDVEDAVSVLEAEHPNCDIVVARIPESESVSHSLEEGQHTVDADKPTPSPEVNTVRVVELVDARADNYVIEDTGDTVAEHNPGYPEDDPVVKGRYPNMDSDDVWHFPESRLRQI